MTFFLHQGGVVMSSQITHTHRHTIIKIHPLPIYLTHEPWFSVVVPFLQFLETSSKNTVPSETHSVTYMYQGSPLFPIFRVLSERVEKMFHIRGFEKCFKHIKVKKQLCPFRVSNNCTPFSRFTSAPFWVTIHNINTVHRLLYKSTICTKNRLL